jgi:copper chaperone CopZ
METLTVDVPAMYGDHHVLEVRRLLLELAGVQEVYASSCFRIVEAQYDPTQVDARLIQSALQQAGYTDELKLPVEAEPVADTQEPKTFFRHSNAYKQTGSAITFAQNVTHTGCALWPCPGLGIITKTGEDDNA